MTVVVNEANFDKIVLEAKRPVLVVFRADWCDACKMIMPTLDGLSLSMKDSLVIGKIDVEDNPMLTQQKGVRGLPTLKLFDDGKLLATKVGALSDTKLFEFLGNYLDL
jgi:thioredoxin 1